MCNKFTGEYSCRSMISINLLSNFTEILLQHGCFPVNLLHIFRTPFPKNSSGGLLLSTCFFNTNNCLTFSSFFLFNAFPSMTECIMFFSSVFSIMSTNDASNFFIVFSIMEPCPVILCNSWFTSTSSSFFFLFFGRLLLLLQMDFISLPGTLD